MRPAEFEEAEDADGEHEGVDEFTGHRGRVFPDGELDREERGGKSGRQPRERDVEQTPVGMAANALRMRAVLREPPARLQATRTISRASVQSRSASGH